MIKLLILNVVRKDQISSFDATTHFVVLEVDEFQHKRTSYTQECEDIRMLTILQDLGMPTIFLRYNPDDYKDKVNKTIKISQKERETQLLKYLDMCMQTKPKDESEYLRVIYLFYDEFEISKQATIDPLKVSDITKYKEKN